MTIKRIPGKTAGSGWNPLNWVKTPKPVPKPEFWTAPNATIPFQWIRLKATENWERSVVENGIQVFFLLCIVSSCKHNRLCISDN